MYIRKFSRRYYCEQLDYFNIGGIQQYSYVLRDRLNKIFNAQIIFLDALSNE